MKPRPGGALAVFAAALLSAIAAPPTAGALGVANDGPQRWIESPYRQFGAPQALPGTRAILLDEADDPAVGAVLAATLQRLDAGMFGKDGWRSPFDPKEPLRIYLARHEAGGIREVSSQGTVEGGRLARAAVLLDASGLSANQIAREVARQIVRATMNAYGAPEDAFLTPAVVEALAVDPGDALADEDAASLAAAPEVDFRGNPAALGRFWVDEVLREVGGSGFFRQVWERAAATEETPLSAALRMLPDASASREEAILARAAARFYANVEVEVEPAPARLRRFDLEAGALDAAAPEELSVRHRTFLPEDSDDALRVSWPEDAGAGAAVVRYRDAALPADVLLLAPGDVRRIPLSGVARVDWIVAGSPQGGGGLRAPAAIEEARSNVFTGLEARATGADRPRLTWRTGSHEGMWGWAIFREELRPDGRIARRGPEIVPSSERADEPYAYAFVDSSAVAGTYYRYTVWAVTDEGLLARAFAVTLRAGE
jgi:hypothetical protein